MAQLEILRGIDFGQPVAEQELEALHSYFVETAQWQSLYNGGIDVVYGAKGSGKSALYALLNNYKSQLFARGVLLRFAENPRGATAFSDMQVAPPASELEFVNLWKLYLLTLLGEYFAKKGTSTPAGANVLTTLKDSGLLQIDSPLASFIAKTRAYIKKFFNPESFESNLSFDENRGTVTGVGVKVSFREPDEQQARRGVLSVTDLLQKADTELKASGFKMWFLFDRLDVAFADSPELEANALRALFKVYLDIAALDNIELKVFLRSDIWQRITREGFREATHITKATTIAWERHSLLNLVIRRFVNNRTVLDGYGVTKSNVLSSISEQEGLFYRIFPRKVSSGKNPDTLEWIIGRTQDANKVCAPRDIINLVKAAIARQIRALELGQEAPPDGNLFTRAIIKDAQSDASKEKVEKHLFAEHPTYRPWIDRRRAGKSRYGIQSLASLWEVTPDEALVRAQALVDIGFWAKEQKDGDTEVWIPFIYRDGLDISQGQAD